MAGGGVVLTQTTNYPFSGDIAIEVEPSMQGEEFTLWMRIPTWCDRQFVPGELYSYADESDDEVQVKINGRQVKSPIKNGYMPLRREWKSGDRVEIELPMPVRYSVADERVEADRNRVCVTRGPLVYCAEEPDNKYEVQSYVIDGNAQTNSEVEEFNTGVLEGIPAINIAAGSIHGTEGDNAPLVLIPYYAWNNRGDNKAMNVWFARDAQTANEKME
jgi:DUF1680 family protein